MLLRCGWSFGLAILILALVLGFPDGQAQPTGPLAQFKENARQMHIVARFPLVPGIPLRVALVQTVTAVALRSRPGETLWITEREHIDPDYIYQKLNLSGDIEIEFFIFIDTLDPARLQERRPGELFEVVSLTNHHAVIKELRSRSVPDLPITLDPKPGEAAVIAPPEGGAINSAPVFVERPVTITEVSAGNQLFFIPFPDPDDERTHGAPVFVQRDGVWKLAGIRVAHGRSQKPGVSAVANLSAIEPLLKETVRVLDPSEYRVAQVPGGDIVLELHNVREPRNAKGVHVIVEATINFSPQTFSEKMDIVNGRGTKTVRLGRIGDQVEVQRVTIRVPG